MFKISRASTGRNLFLATALFGTGAITGAIFSNSANKKDGSQVTEVTQNISSPHVTQAHFLPAPDEKKKGTLAGFDPDALSPENIKNRKAAKEELKQIPELNKKITKAANYVEKAVVAVNCEGGSASGFIYSSDENSSIIITNNHVVEIETTEYDRRGRGTKKKIVPDEIKIILLDGRELSGKVIGRDANVDVALIKVNQGGLPYLDLATSYPDYGDFVINIGHPFDFGWTFVLGNYSGKDRKLDSLKTNVVQITATVNPGHSGGPVTDLNGEVIGINYGVIRGDTGQYDGLSFFIPYEAIKQVCSRVLE